MEAKRKKQIIIGVTGLLTVVVLYGVYVLLTKKDKKTAEEDSTTTAQGFCKSSGFPLSYGSCGKEVGDLQRFLNSKQHPPLSLLKVDEKFGKRTEQLAKQHFASTSITASQFAQAKSKSGGGFFNRIFK